MDICLVNVPFSPIERPSISLGVLQSELKKNNIKSKTVYYNIDFANEIGLPLYAKIVLHGFAVSLGDWMFSKHLFPDASSIDYINYLKENYSETLNTSLLGSDEGRCLREKAYHSIEKQADEILVKYNPKIVACSSMFDQHAACLSLLKCIKRKSPETVTLLGGANCEEIMGLTTHKQFDFVDYIVSGHADYLITNLVTKILQVGINMGYEEVPTQVLAPVFRQKGYPEISHLKPVKHKLQSVPDYDDYFEKLNENKFLKKSILPTIPIETSRGCHWGKCKFCGLNGHKLNYLGKKTEEVTKEINYLTLKYETNKIEFVDNAINIRLMNKALEKVKRKDLTYFAEIRTTVKKDEFQELYSNGFIWLQPGIENLSNNFLQHMNKGTHVLQNLQVMKWARELGIHIVWSIMYHFPKENNDWYNDLLEIMPKLTHLSPPGSLNKLRYDRFSEYHTHSEKYNLELQPREYYKYIYPFEENILTDFVYFFEEKKRI